MIDDFDILFKNRNVNFGDCPYENCDGVFFFEVPDKTPAFSKVLCDKCGRNVWYKFSRIDPKAWTEANFEKNFKIDYENKTIEEIKKS